MFVRISENLSIQASIITQVHLNRFKLIDKENEPLKAKLDITIEAENNSYHTYYTCIDEVLYILEKFDFNKEANQTRIAIEMRRQKTWDLVIEKSL